VRFINNIGGCSGDGCVSAEGLVGPLCWFVVCGRAGCTPDGGFFGDLGTDLALAFPQATWTEEPDCRSGSNQLFGSVGGGPLNVGVGQEWGGDELVQDGEGLTVFDLSLRPSDWKRLSPGGGGGFVFWFC